MTFRPINVQRIWQRDIGLVAHRTTQENYSNYLTPLSTKVIFIKTGTTSFVIPADFNIANNKIEAIGEGGPGAAGTTVVPGGGGGGGEYAKLVNYSRHGPYETIAVTVGSGVGGSATGIDDETQLLARGGSAASGQSAGSGGRFGTGTVTNDGGAGSAGGTTAGGSAGGAAGPSGIGGAAGSSGVSSGAGGSADGGNQAGAAGVSIAAAGNPGIAEATPIASLGMPVSQWIQTSNQETASPSSGASGAGPGGGLTEGGGNAVNYGGGGGGGDQTASGSSGAGTGSPGLIIMTYVAIPPPPFGNICL